MPSIITVAVFNVNQNMIGSIFSKNWNTTSILYGTEFFNNNENTFYSQANYFISFDLPSFKNGISYAVG